LVAVGEEERIYLERMSSGPFQAFLPLFPNLPASNPDVTSPIDKNYNCIAHAAGVSDKWWWPDPLGDYFWPASAMREETIGAFVDAFRTMGYDRCVDGVLESGVEKIALFADGGRPTHAARQLSDGRWTSKLGKDIDISHELGAVEGPLYGTVAAFMRRSTQPSVRRFARISRVFFAANALIWSRLLRWLGGKR
jgi:hypothetical protein